MGAAPGQHEHGMGDVELAGLENDDVEQRPRGADGVGDEPVELLGGARHDGCAGSCQFARGVLELVPIAGVHVNKRPVARPVPGGPGCASAESRPRASVGAACP